MINIQRNFEFSSVSDKERSAFTFDINCDRQRLDTIIHKIIIYCIVFETDKRKFSLL